MSAFKALRRSGFVLVIFLALSGAAPVQANKPFMTITPPHAATRVAAGRNGYLYFTEVSANKIGYLSPGGLVGEIDIPTANAGPVGIAAGLDGAIWFTEENVGKIGRYTPNALSPPYVVEFEIPTAQSMPIGICQGPDGAMWFTEFNGNKIGRISFAGVITEFTLPFASSGPYDIALGYDGALWFTEFYGGRIGRLTTAGAFADHVVPSGTSSWPAGIALGPDGRLWFCIEKTNKIGTAWRDAYGNWSFEEYPLPGSHDAPFLIVAASDGALWFTELASLVGRITTAGTVTEVVTDVSTDGIAIGPDGNVWFAEADLGRIGCLSHAGDVNRNGKTDVADVFYLINFLFANGSPPM